MTRGLSALELLQRSQYGESVDEIELVFHEWVQGRWLSEWNTLAGRWQTELGLQSEYSVIDPFSYADMLQQGEIEIIIGLVEAAYPDPHAILGEFSSMFGRSREAESFQPLRSMIDEASGEADLVKRANMYADIDPYIITTRVWPSRYSGHHQTDTMCYSRGSMGSTIPCGAVPCSKMSGSMRHIRASLGLVI